MDQQGLVHLVDDDAAVRRAASALLRTSGFAVRTYASGDELIAQLDRVGRLDAILLDIRMPGLDGLEVQKALNARGILTPVIILTGHGDVALAVEAMKNGAHDFIEKPFSGPVLVEALRGAFARAREANDDRDRREEAERLLRRLTPRERDVLEGLAKGYPNKTIGYDLGISPRTVEIHRANAMTKLEAVSFSDLLRTAFAAGLGGRNPAGASPAHEQAD